ncbi:ubiquitin fusion degradation [Trichoderma arundinaceum]|uniref:Ubiquitin fusion degradation n=1 Tax=Trichoderma arundinaceum TaxID=490622 RepID=A0A395NQG4_TRIAR|nr:ubiquitin fusion degradation [Trichoderma arundinaceum]
MDEPISLQWSDAFSILLPSDPVCSKLPGDKIILPPSALQQLLSASSSRAATASANSSNGFFGSSYLSDQPYGQETQRLPNPLIFRLVNPKNGNVVYAGIREFSAPEGTIGLSSLLFEALAIEPNGMPLGAEYEASLDPAKDIDVLEGNQIRAHAVQLQKGTYVRLRPLEAGYDPDDWKPLLERQLRQNFTTLTKNTVIPVQGSRGESFKLLVDKFAPEGDGICVIDTDLEVDIEALNEEQARETLRQIIARGKSDSSSGSSKGGELSIWKDVEGQVVPGQYVDYTLPSWDRSQNLVISISDISDSDSLDLFVTPKSRQQRALPRDAVHVFGDFSPAQHGVKSITLSPTNIELEDAESLLISVHAYQDPGSGMTSTTPVAYTIRAKAAPLEGTTAGETMEIDKEDHSADEEQCTNCLQWVPKRTMVLHQNFCLRNNILCPICKSVFKKGSPEYEAHWHCSHDEAHGDSPLGKAKHDQVFHTDHRCPACEFSTNSLSDLARHRTSVCPGKIILCRFCHLEVPQEGDPFNPSPEVVLSGMTAHELADGARTTECHLCDKIIRLRDMETHLKHHELDKVNRSKPSICRNVNCGRTLYGVGPRGQIGTASSQAKTPGNDIGLCSLCFGPLYVSMHDPDGKALRRRIERRYLSQMMTGCGKSHCANEWCKTGRSNSGLEPKGSSAAAVLPLVKPLLAGALDALEPSYFCVDETSQTSRKLAGMVAADKAWDLEWCVAAAESERADLDKMRDWLQSWAPRR